MHWISSWRTLGFALALSLATSGCGVPHYEVTGKVTYNGAPLAKSGGKIVFVGFNGDQAAADIAEDGTYKAPGVVAGPNQVAVYYPNPKASRDKSTKLKPGEYRTSIPPLLTPSSYADATKSGLGCQVAKNETFDVDIKGPKIP
ncbi:hypothetical protein KIH39_18175 [Telmatocola sphagniphila]|uniref:Carboxypeptidase regulatory-like domain-containing protein n=1 Tax=Telmatocola sphagniphila TaxID=1123043 RepID=A0A8E6B3Q0_9BACT|nr:hypothetical protein [Telmatocola sphagniphila]QVL30767.1 hypothetical protein KIH39_18175 [Telmatocola sphagniphila]